MKERKYKLKKEDGPMEYFVYGWGDRDLTKAIGNVEGKEETWIQLNSVDN